MNNKEVMQQALEALDKLSKLGNGNQDGNSLGNTTAQEAREHLFTALAQPEQEPMTEVADRFAHRMALELECVLSDGAYSNKWYKSAMQVLSEYRSAMNAIHEQHSPTFMGEPHSLEERHTAEKRDRQNAAHSRAINAAPQQEFIATATHSTSSGRVEFTGTESLTELLGRFGSGKLVHLYAADIVEVATLRDKLLRDRDEKIERLSQLFEQERNVSDTQALLIERLTAERDALAVIGAGK